MSRTKPSKYRPSQCWAVVALALVVGLLATVVQLGTQTAEARPSVKAENQSISSIKPGSISTAEIASPRPASSSHLAPRLEVLLTVVSQPAECPTTFESAQQVARNPGVDDNDPETGPDFDTLATQLGDTFTMCVNAVNSGTASAENVKVYLPYSGEGPRDVPGSCDECTANWDAKAEWQSSYDYVATDHPANVGEGPHIVEITGYTSAGVHADGSGSYDHAGISIEAATAPGLNVLLTVATEPANCPATFANASSVANNPGTDDNDDSTGPDFDTISAAVGDVVVYCVNAINANTESAYDVWTWSAQTGTVNICVDSCEWTPGSEHQDSFEREVMDHPTNEAPAAVVIAGNRSDGSDAPGHGTVDHAGIVLGASTGVTQTTEIECAVAFTNGTSIGYWEDHANFVETPGVVLLLGGFEVAGPVGISTGGSVSVSWDYEQSGAPTQTFATAPSVFEPIGATDTSVTYGFADEMVAFEDWGTFLGGLAYPPAGGYESATYITIGYEHPLCDGGGVVRTLGILIDELTYG